MSALMLIAVGVSLLQVGALFFILIFKRKELHMTARYTKNPEQREAAESLMEKIALLVSMFV